MFIQPSSFDLNLIYKCIKCGSQHWFNSREAKFGPTFICCNTIHRIRPVNNFKVLCDFNNTQVIDEAIKILSSYGYTKKDLVNSKIQANTAKELVMKFLASQTNESQTHKVT